MPDNSYFVFMDLYGPLQPWFDKTWKPGDFELLKKFYKSCDDQGIANKNLH